MATQPNAPRERLLADFPIPDLDEWRAEVTRLLKGADYDRTMQTKTPEGITLQPLYTAADTAALSPPSPPGTAPFVRGTRRVADRDHAWQIAQRIDHPDYAAYNDALRYDLERGVTTAVLPIDFAGRHGLDPDQALTGEVGNDGVSVVSIRGFSHALRGVDLERVPVTIETGSSGLFYYALLLAHADAIGVDRASLRGTIANDPIGSLAATGSLPYPLSGAFDEVACMTAYAADETPHLHTVRVDGSVYAEAGANAIQELAGAMATAITYLREAEQRGVSPTVMQQHLGFSFSLGSNLFMEIAKVRAARQLWNRILEVSGVKESNRCSTIHGKTTLRTKTVFDPYVNMLRDTTEAFAGAASGVDSLEVVPFDTPHGLADSFSRRIARNVQLLLRDESSLGRLLDPGGGSYYIESLTARLADDTWREIQRLETEGGLVPGLLSGSVQSSIQNSASAVLTSVARRRTVLVGTNQYPNAQEQPLDRDPFDYDGFYTRRVAALEELRTANEQATELAVLNRLSELAGNGDPAQTVPVLIEAARHGATLGEVTRSLPTRTGEAITVEAVTPIRLAEEFEVLRASVAASTTNTNVFLATVGPVARYMPRLDFAASYFEVGGFTVERTSGFADATAALNAARASDASIVVIVGLDETYPDAIPTIASGLPTERLVVVAGPPPDEPTERQYNEAGVDVYIHLRSNILEVLTGIAERVGVER